MFNRVATISLEVDSSYITKSDVTDFETAIEICGSGRFHYGFLLLCGAIFVCAAAQVGINAYILPSAECDLKLTSEDKGFLNVAFLSGAVISGLVCGIFADLFGRKRVILYALILDSVVTICASLSQSYPMFVTCRAINGFTMSIPGALVFTYLGEFQTEKQRAKTICYLGFFWTFGWLILPGLAWAIMSFPFKLSLNGFTFNSWRLFLAIIAIPTFSMAMIATTYPESPKFLLSQGKPEKALNILRKIYALNTGHSEFEYPVKELISSHDLHLTTENWKPKVRKNGHLANLLQRIWRQLSTLFSPPLLQQMVLVSSMFFMNMFGYYGFGLWLPELFNRFENYYARHPNVTVSVCEMMRSDSTFNDRVDNENVYSCDNTIDGKVFLHSVTINAVSLLGFLASSFLADRVSRRTLPVITMAVAGLCGFSIYFVRSSLQNLVLSCIFCLTIATANFCITSVVVDIFPTQVGAVAICIMTSFGRLGAIASNMVFGMLLDIACEVPIFLVASIVLLGGLLGLWIPPREKKNVY